MHSNFHCDMSQAHKMHQEDFRDMSQVHKMQQEEDFYDSSHNLGKLFPKQSLNI